MRWSWKIAQIAGIGVYLHFTFLILLIWVGLSFGLLRQSLLAAFGAIGFIIILFGIVLLHELGHALTARRYGIKTRDIILLPIGGVARLERMPENPKQELIIALAGPAVNVALAILLAGVLLLSAGVGALTASESPVSAFLSRLMWINVFLAAFNLLPAFPMDGGRVLRGLLAMRMDYARATRIAANIGQGMAFLFGFVGLFINPFLILIALFVWWGASQEASFVEMKSALNGVPVRQIMITEFHALSPQDNLSRAIEHILAGWQHDFPVIEDGKVVGVLTRNDLLNGLGKAGPGATVGEYMQRDFLTASTWESAEKAFSRLQRCECHTVPVVDNDQLQGMVTMENVGEFLMIKSALGQAHGGISGVDANRYQPA
jgi:Zn-dependent protease/predicted transcriptional regulator